MSKVIKLKYNDFFQSNKIKLLQILISEIVYLNKFLSESINDNDKKILKKAIDELYYIFQIIEKRNVDLSDRDFDKVIKYIYQIIENILLNKI